MLVIVISVLILVVCGVVLVRAPRWPGAYWLFVGVYVAVALILSGLAETKFGGGAGLAVFVVLALLGRLFLRPHLVLLRRR